MTIATVTVTTGSRLHFGPLSVDAPAGGKFGGVGVMIQAPRVILTVSKADEDLVIGDEMMSTRVTEFLRSIRRDFPNDKLPGCKINVSETIPAHRGFGSGTQLGLALARATSIILGESEATMEVLARRVGRGLRSAIGLHGFHRGGFLVDGGRQSSSQLGTLVSRIDFPADWRFVLAAPRKSLGLSGAQEQATFARQPRMPQAVTAELCRIVLMDWLPSVIGSDFTRCSEALDSFGGIVGDFFSCAQGGVFAHMRMAEWASLLHQRGIRGVAQTSWGPTVAALCLSDSHARQLQTDFANDASWNDCWFEIAVPLNHGAAVEIVRESFTPVSKTDSEFGLL